MDGAVSEYPDCEASEATADVIDEVITNCAISERELSRCSAGRQIELLAAISSGRDTHSWNAPEPRISDLDGGLAVGRIPHSRCHGKPLNHMLPCKS